MSRGRRPESGAYAARSSSRRRSLRRLGRAEVVPIDRCTDHVAVDPLERSRRPARPGSPRRGGRSPRPRRRPARARRAVARRRGPGRRRDRPDRGGRRRRNPRGPIPAAAARPPRRPRRSAAATAPRRRSASRSLDVTTTIRSISGAAASAASVQASSGRPSISAASLSVPSIRVERPAPTTIASAPDRRTPSPLNRGEAGRRSSDRRRSGGPG